MNIKPPMWSWSPSQVAPEWRWFWEKVFTVWHPYSLNYTTSEGKKRFTTTTLNTPQYKIKKNGGAWTFNEADRDAFEITGKLPGWRDNNQATVVAYIEYNGTSAGEIISIADGLGIRVGESPVDEIKGFYRINGSWPFVGSSQDIAFTGPRLVAYSTNPNASEQVLWLDGIRVATGSNSGDIFNEPGTDTFIGRHGDGNTNYDFNGTIYWVAVFDTALTDDDVSSLAKDPFGPFRQANRLFLPDLPRSFGSVVVPSDTQRQPITVQSSSPTDINISQQPELVTNGGLDTDTVWNKGTGWTISGGVASKSPGTQSNLSQTLGTVLGKTYRVTFTVSNYVAGIVRPFLGTVVGSNRTADGTYVEDITYTEGSDDISIQGTSTFEGDIDNVSVREINIKITP